MYFGYGFRPVRHVIKHVVIDNAVECVVWIRDRLGVDVLVGEFTSRLFEVHLGVVEHPRREIGQRDVPT